MQREIWIDDGDVDSIIVTDTGKRFIKSTTGKITPAPTRPLTEGDDLVQVSHQPPRTPAPTPTPTPAPPVTVSDDRVQPSHQPPRQRRTGSDQGKQPEKPTLPEIGETPLGYDYCEPFDPIPLLSSGQLDSTTTQAIRLALKNELDIFLCLSEASSPENAIATLFASVDDDFLEELKSLQNAESTKDCGFWGLACSENWINSTSWIGLQAAYAPGAVLDFVGIANSENVDRAMGDFIGSQANIHDDLFVDENSIFPVETIRDNPAISGAVVGGSLIALGLIFGANPVLIGAGTNVIGRAVSGKYEDIPSETAGGKIIVDSIIGGSFGKGFAKIPGMNNLGDRLLNAGILNAFQGATTDLTDIGLYNDPDAPQNVADFVENRAIDFGWGVGAQGVIEVFLFAGASAHAQNQMSGYYPSFFEENMPLTARQYLESRSLYEQKLAYRAGAILFGTNVIQPIPDAVFPESDSYKASLKGICFSIGGEPEDAVCYPFVLK